jgi:hypothetical protein
MTENQDHRPDSAAAPLTEADLAYLREHRVVVIGEAHADSSGTQHVWLVSPEQAEQVAGFLGKPDSTTIVPKGSLATLMDIAEGLPTYDHE